MFLATYGRKREALNKTLYLRSRHYVCKLVFGYKTLANSPGSFAGPWSRMKEKEAFHKTLNLRSRPYSPKTGFCHETLAAPQGLKVKQMNEMGIFFLLTKEKADR